HEIEEERGWLASQRQVVHNALLASINDGEAVGRGLGDVGEAAIAAEGDAGGAAADRDLRRHLASADLFAEIHNDELVALCPSAHHIGEIESAVVRRGRRRRTQTNSLCTQ